MTKESPEDVQPAADLWRSHGRETKRVSNMPRGISRDLTRPFPDSLRGVEAKVLVAHDRKEAAGCSQTRRTSVNLRGRSDTQGDKCCVMSL